MNYQNYPNNDLEILLLYQQEIESILQEITDIIGVPHSLINKVYYLKTKIDCHIQLIENRTQKIVPPYED